MRVILMRHCKSSWGDPGLDDHARPLNKRGVQAADALGKYLAKKSFIPTDIMVSDALRTRQTWAGLAPALPEGLKATPFSALYLAHESRMLEILRTRSEGCVLMIGHNPGMGALAELLVRTAPEHERFWDYPTGATLVLDFDTVPSAGGGEVVGFVVPRDLRAAG